ncbi:aspartyl-tRNA(Asn)/glutamyl-tRNA(Gln) amidotransferase subunit A [Tamaricihabitans halophyticus]|uniref:Aspartyl-tRNA(Asn)/glutamyl-tRNA(Gln) amidotransferase subunit A n=1 Tax=Tamaricihabitans halophyticus TaxID=1262583 RepID=A0A4R2PXB5_9PSEU|nr:amidase [Tamaricihabitans halophyticus]TCP38821.1 aspartyl-tRNA(Asn)/glutamyl-tRNA(Gln) amidotransferase subunit A [Tamaricihabitans halophyticus]
MMSTDYLTIADAGAALRRGDVSAQELMARALSRADALDEAIGVFISRYTESAMEAARAADTRFAQGRDRGPLDGIPIAIKDIIAESQGPTTAQSLVIHPEWGESIGDAPVVSRLKAAGAIIVGKTTTQEFAIGAPDPEKPFPIPASAWDPKRWAGGSSSGSGSAVATEMALGAIGTDTAGSIRIPAAFNGISGLLPTAGLVPRSGVVPLGHSLDRTGPMARSVQDCAILLSVLAGDDPSDASTVIRPSEDYASGLSDSLEGVRVGVDDLDRFAAGGIDPEQPARFGQAVELLQEAGAELIPLEIPLYPEAVAVDFVVMLAEAHSYHRADLLSRWSDYGRPTRITLAGGASITAAEYIQAQRVRRLLRQRVADLFTDVDLIATPTGHRGAPSLTELDPLNPLGAMFSLHTPYWNAIGNSTLAIPIGLSSESTPLSLSLSGPAWSESSVLRAGHAIQQRSAFHLDRTPLLKPPRPRNTLATA